jgi:hypothetical protein
MLDTAVMNAFENAMQNEVNWAGGPVPEYVVSDVCFSMGNLDTNQIQQVESMVHDLLDTHYFYNDETPDDYHEYVLYCLKIKNENNAQ